MLYGNYCYIFIENFPQKFFPCKALQFGFVWVQPPTWQALKYMSTKIFKKQENSNTKKPQKLKIELKTRQKGFGYAIFQAPL